MDIMDSGMFELDRRADCLAFKPFRIPAFVPVAEVSQDTAVAAADLKYPKALALVQ